jgi:hypothetical protein
MTCGRWQGMIEGKLIRTNKATQDGCKKADRRTGWRGRGRNRIKRG